MNKITFLASYPELDGVFPEPEPTSRHIPQWYKNQPSMIDDKIEHGTMKLTVKKCQAFFDAMSLGYVLKMPVDLYIDTTQERMEIQLPTEMNQYRSKILSHHSTEQVSHYPTNTNIYMDDILRIHPIWMVKTEPGYSTLFMPLIHQEHLPLKPVEAIIDSDNFFSDGHLSYFVEKGFKGVIKQGTPIVQVFPFKRDDWEMELVRDFPENEKNIQRKKVRSTFQNGYRLKMWVKKVFK